MVRPFDDRMQQFSCVLSMLVSCMYRMAWYVSCERAYMSSVKGQSRHLFSERHLAAPASRRCRAAFTLTGLNAPNTKFPLKIKVARAQQIRVFLFLGKAARAKAKKLYMYVLAAPALRRNRPQRRLMLTIIRA